MSHYTGMAEICEWDPDSNRAATGERQCPNLATVSLGNSPSNWHLCESCSRLPAFQRLRKRVAYKFPTLAGRARREDERAMRICMPCAKAFLIGGDYADSKRPNCFECAAPLGDWFHTRDFAEHVGSLNEERKRRGLPPYTGNP